MEIDTELILKYCNGTLTPFESKMLNAWVSESPDNANLLFSIKESYDFLDYEKDLTKGATEKEWKKLDKKLPSGKRWPRYLGIAGSLAACLLIGLYWGRDLLSKEKNKADSRAVVSVSTDIGQQASTILPDGSVVLLNACSTLSYNYSDWPENRTVSLNGEASFDVIHDPDNMFIVKTRDYDVKVFGTVFNVTAYDKENISVVALKSGKVDVDFRGADQSVHLAPGESCLFNVLARQYKIAKTDNVRSFDWERGQLMLDNESLSNLTEKLYRRYGYEFAISERAGKLSFVGTITDHSLNEFLAILMQTAPKLKYSIDQKQRVVKLFMEEEGQPK